MRKLRITKEELLKENSILKNNIDCITQKDEQLRKQLSEVLSNQYAGISSIYNQRDIMSWEKIFFSIGELNSDANYTQVQMARDEFREKCRLLEKELEELKQSRLNKEK